MSTNSDFRERYYLAALESPGSWLIRGIELKSAAERLDWLQLPARDDERGFTHFHQYSMLLAMSFEALLKGIITRARIKENVEPVLERQHFVHDLRALAQTPECDNLGFTEAELDALGWLSPFIEWGGRYPMPRRPSQMEVGFGISDAEYELQKSLWERVYYSLKEDAWVMKGGPERLGGFKKKVGRSVPSSE